MKKIARRPRTDRIVLFEHQKQAIDRMEQLEKTRTIQLQENVQVFTNVAIYADPIGSGKTLSMLSLIERDEMKNENCYMDSWRSGNSFAIRRTKTFHTPLINATLVVASNVVISHWETEIKKTSLKHFSITSKSQAHQVRAVNVEGYNVVFCTATMYSTFFPLFEGECWKRLVVDEADSIHIPNMQRSPACFSWLITATPVHLEELHSRSWIALMFRGFHRSAEKTRQALTIQSRTPVILNIPEPRIIEHEYAANRIAQALCPYVSNSIITLIEAGNVVEAIAQLGGKSSNENLVDLVCKNFRSELEDAHYRIARYSTREGDEKYDKDLITKWSQRAEDLERKIKGLTERFDTCLVETQCFVCYDSIKYPVLVTCCQHVACAECIVCWMKQKPTCPLCRSELFADKLIHLTESKECGKREEKKSLKKTKPEIIAEYLSAHSGAKAIIFSEHDASWTTVRSFLTDKGLESYVLQGTKHTKDKRLQDFEAGLFPVLFINSRENGAGIHLPFVTDVFIYHNMSRETREQAIGRGQRIGRTTRLNVHLF